MIERENNFISLVVYINENEKNEINFLKFVCTVLSCNFKNYEVICVSNSSNPIITQHIKQFKAENEEISISFIHLDEKQGLEDCMNAGVDLAIGDFILEFDSCYIDYDSSVIMEIYNKALEGYDIVAAVPPQKYMKVASRFFYFIYNHFSDMKKLKTERFRILSRRAENRVSGLNKVIPYRKAVYASAGLNITEILYSAINNPTGELRSDVHQNDVAVNSLILFTNVTYRLSAALSFIMTLVMLSTGFYTIFVYFGTHKPVEGWAPIMGLISLGFLAIFIILTVLIKYLDIILRLVFRKQKYMIVNIEKL